MRSIRGWIINLLDGLGPPPASVHLQARVEATNTDLDLSDHGLGRLDQVHVIGGSVSPDFADNIGHFGWDMELSPGPIDILVNPTDPQNEYRRRFPDESAQFGKAFISDLERLGWAGGKSGFVWNGISGGRNVFPVGIETNPTRSWQYGNGSIASFGVGDIAGRFVVRRFLAILGGVPFSVEMNDLVVPIDGQPAAPANGGGSDRWDLYCLAMHDEPGSALHGKQSFELFQGVPGAGIPLYPIPSFPIRRIPLHVLKMPSGNVYTDAFDVRPWLNPPWIVTGGRVEAPWDTTEEEWQDISSYTPGTVVADSVINSHWPFDFSLAPWLPYEGAVEWDGLIQWEDIQGSTAFIECLTRGVNTFGADVTPNLTPGLRPLQSNAGVTGTQSSAVHAKWNISANAIPSYHSEAAGLDDTFHRSWYLIRVGFRFHQNNNPFFEVDRQRALLILNPVSY